MSEYDQQAANFLKETGATIEVLFLKNDFHFDSDKETRDIYKVTITRGKRVFSFNFGQSINASGKYLVGYKMAGNAIHRDAKPFNDLNAAKTAAYKNRFVVITNKNFSTPSAYSVLACLTKNDPGSLEDFCDEFGYDIDSKKAEKVYLAVCEEFKNVQALFSDEEFNVLQEIQ